MIKTDQGKMIASLLNRPYKKIVLDRFIKQIEEETVLITKPEEVKRGVAEHYKKQAHYKIDMLPDSPALDQKMVHYKLFRFWAPAKSTNRLVIVFFFPYLCY